MIGSKYNGGFFSADVFWEGHSYLDFDKRKIRKAMRAIGADIRKVARKKVARRAVSDAGAAPGKQSGTLQRSIRVKVSKPGLLVRIAPDKTEAMGTHFYPAFLNYGVRQGSAMKGLAAGEGVGVSNRRRRGQRAKEKAARANGNWRLAPRENYMEKSLEERKEHARQVLAAALDNALIARK
jgi:hypothetical protein